MPFIGNRSFGANGQAGAPPLSREVLATHEAGEVARLVLGGVGDILERPTRAIGRNERTNFKSSIDVDDLVRAALRKSAGAAVGGRRS